VVKVAAKSPAKTPAKPKLNGKAVPKTCAQPSGKVERWVCWEINGAGSGSCVVEAASWFDARTAGELRLELKRGEVEARRENEGKG
jgi:hypothetical protein